MRGVLWLQLPLLLPDSVRQWNRKTTKYTAHRCAQARCHAEPDELALDVPDAFAPCWIEPPAHSVVELEHIAR